MRMLRKARAKRMLRSSLQNGAVTWMKCTTWRSSFGCCSKKTVRNISKDVCQVHLHDEESMVRVSLSRKFFFVKHNVLNGLPRNFEGISCKISDQHTVQIYDQTSPSIPSYVHSFKLKLPDRFTFDVRFLVPGPAQASVDLCSLMETTFWPKSPELHP